MSIAIGFSFENSSAGGDHFKFRRSQTFHCHYVQGTCLTYTYPHNSYPVAKSQQTHHRMSNQQQQASMMPPTASRRVMVAMVGMTVTVLFGEQPTVASAYLPTTVPSIAARTLFVQNSSNRRSHHCFHSSSTAAFLNPKDVVGEEPSNEWGIPYSASLPPLGPNTKPISKALANGGRITLVGSGPGDPDLLTVSAYKLLTENPDALVIADRLVSAEILALIPGEVKIARKLPGCAELAQEEIYWWAYQGLNQGKHVIRLKIGDPFVFGRGGEEVLTFRNFGVEPSIIPVSLFLFGSVMIWRLTRE